MRRIPSSRRRGRQTWPGVRCPFPRPVRPCPGTLLCFPRWPNQFPSSTKCRSKERNHHGTELKYLTVGFASGSVAKHEVVHAQVVITVEVVLYRQYPKLLVPFPAILAVSARVPIVGSIDSKVYLRQVPSGGGPSPSLLAVFASASPRCRLRLN
jgi:hypothetical protein